MSEEYWKGRLRVPHDAEKQRAWEELRTKYREAIEDQYQARPELHQKNFRPKAGVRGPTMQFSRTLLDYAGGIWDLERDWELDE